MTCVLVLTAVVTLFSSLLLTQSMLDHQLSAQYDQERKTLLEPAEETA